MPATREAAIVARAREYVRAATREHDASHDACHAERVACNAQRLGGLEPAGLRRACVLAALTHDTCDPKYVDKPEACARLRDALRELVEMDAANSIVAAVAHVSFTRLRTLGAPRAELGDGSAAWCIWERVSDADMLEATGVVGVLRTLLYQGHRRRGLAESLAYCETLGQCASLFRGRRGRAEVRRRVARMRALAARMRRSATDEAALGRWLIATGATARCFDEVVRDARARFGALGAWWSALDAETRWTRGKKKPLGLQI